jgi:hypothetical protein
MPLSRLGWRIGIPLIIAFVLLYIGAVKFIRDAYPADPFKSEAPSNAWRATRALSVFRRRSR